MKNILRMILFPAFAVYLTALWNKGFVISYDPMSFLKVAVTIGVLYYIIRPITNILLLPLNLLTLGLASKLLFIGLLYIAVVYLGLIDINAWTFPGLQISSVTIPTMALSEVQNIALSSISLSVIIGLLEKVI